jgi:hypothetical protein
VLLGTSGGVTEVGPELHPYFFQGFLAEPGPAAAGMLACAAVARARYYTPASVIPAIVADPVVTSNGDRLRFESFSGCCGVHARLDLLPDALAGQPVRSGSTNVDFNEGMRAALGGAAVAGPLLLSVGADEVAVATLDASVTERKVTLPERWLKGFGEVQALARDMRLVAERAGAEVQRFIQVIPRSARRPLWAVPAGRGLALAASPQPGAACLAGPHRLAELGPLLRFARGLRVYGPPVGARSLPVPSAWELDLGRARFNLHLLFELAARIGATTGMPELPTAITALASQKATSRLVTAARRLTNLRSGPAPARGQTITRALAALTAQAET